MRHRTSRHALLLAAACASTFLGACGGAGDDSDANGAAESADGMDTHRLMEHGKVDLGDLIAQKAEFIKQEITDRVVDALPAKVKIDPPIVFGTGDASVRGNDTMSLDDLSIGLSQQFGEKELSTQVNEMRVAYLKSNSVGDKVYIENAVHFLEGFGEDWKLISGGLSTTPTVGFDSSSQVESRVIVAMGSDFRDKLGKQSLGAALKQLRGFVYPRSADDVRAMKPGESFAVNGHGILGVNLGVSVPIFVADPGDLTFRIALSAGVRTAIEGQLDIQLVRETGDQVVLDVGVDKAKTRELNVAVKSSFGLDGLIDSVAHIAGHDIDLGKLVENAIADKINQYASFQIAAQKSTTNSRTTVARMVFHMDGANKTEINAALAQALHGDVRLAQALYNRDLTETNPSVAVAFDLSRSGETTTKSFGIDAFGMNLLHNQVTSGQGTVVTQTPDGARTLIFDSLSKLHTDKLHSHGYTRVAMSGLVFDPTAKGLPSGEANLSAQVLEGDSHMHDEIIMDSADALILALAGKDAVTALNTSQQAFAGKIASLPASHQAILTEAARTRNALIQEGVHKEGFFHNPLSGPSASMAIDSRFDDNSLAILAGKNAAAYKTALLDYIAVVNAERNGSRTMDQVRADAATKYNDTLDAMTKIYTDGFANYPALVKREGQTLQVGKRTIAMGPTGLVIRLAVDDQNAPDLSKSVATSISQLRAKMVQDIFDNLINKANDIKGVDLHREHTVLFPLISMLPQQNVDVGMNLTVDTRGDAKFDSVGFKSVQMQSAGASVKRISGGVFDVNALVNVADTTAADKNDN